MTGRTHDLAAFTALNLVVATQTIPQMSLATAITALGAGFIGALAPDIDQPTADLWNRLPAGSVIGRIFTPFLGGHRIISHSILGTIAFAFLIKYLLGLIGTILLVDTGIVWWSFMIGFVSHLIMDMFTRDGIPLFFPLPFDIGIPPFKSLRIKTGGIFEKSLIFPALLVANLWIVYYHHDKLIGFVKSLF
jgi:inner membrane protein